MKRYLFTWFLATALILLAVAAINLAVDPYGIFRLVDQPGFNSVKPAAASHGAMSKAYQVLRVQPKTLILGNSRAEVGLDPNHPAWPQSARPVYNAALPGTGTATSLLYLKHVLAAAAGDPTKQPTLVLWGVDFMDFLTDPTKHTPPRTAHADNAESMRLMTAPSSTRMRQQLRDYAESTLTLGALVDSLTTLANQRNPYAVDLTPQGFYPMNDYLKITADEGYWAVFRQRDQANTIAYLRRPKSILDATGETSAQLNDLKEVVRLCRQHGITLQLFTYPYQAHLLEIFRITGQWPVFENWKITLVQLLADEAASSNKPTYAFWDFSSINTFTTEDIPAKGDRKARMRWYWEAGHFKSALGDLMLDRMFDQTEQPVDFGVHLTPGSVAVHNASVQAQEQVYRNTHAAEVEVLFRFAAKESSRK
jgi:hypothetical protein